MIKGKNTIYCDSCKAEIPQTKDLIETKHLSGGIQINFFRCKSCGVKYLVDVTDRNVRLKQIELSKLISVQKYIMSLITVDNIEEIEAKSIDNIDKMDNIQAEIKADMAELKNKYKGEL